MMEKNSIKVTDVRKALINSLKSTQKKHKTEGHADILKFQKLYESDHNCTVLKLYSQKHYLASSITDITYWNALQFGNEEDITMFVLRWS